MDGRKNPLYRTPAETLADRYFVDALREALGLGPLYDLGENEHGSRNVDILRFAAETFSYEGGRSGQLPRFVRT